MMMMAIFIVKGKRGPWRVARSLAYWFLYNQLMDSYINQTFEFT